MNDLIFKLLILWSIPLQISHHYSKLNMNYIYKTPWPHLLTRLYPKDIYGAWLQIILIKEVFVVLLSLRLETALIRYLSVEKNLNS